MRSIYKLLRPAVIAPLVLAACVSTSPQKSAEPSDLKTSPHADEKFSYCTIGDCTIMSSALLRANLQIPVTVHHACRLPNQYAMTFDDAPSDNLPNILAILKAKQVKATFFVIGKKLSTPEKRALIKSAYLQGHQISNHSFNHPDLTKLSAADVKKEAIQTRDAILDIVGRDERALNDVHYLRPPYGLINDQVEQTLVAAGFETLRWNADRADWSLSEKDRDVVIARIKQQLDLIKASAGKNINPSMLDLNHDHSEVTTLALPTMIEMIKAKGYKFVTLSECLAGKS